MNQNFKILVATDFSDNSKIANQYALMIAHKLNIDLCFIHAIYIDGTAENILAQVQDLMKTEAERKMLKFLDEFTENNKLTTKPQSTVRFGNVSSVVVNYAKENDFDLIITSTKGASGLKKALIGSNSADLINNGSIPVLIVPENYNKNYFINHIVYACDLNEAEHELGIVVAIARLFNAKVTALHINESEEKSINIDVTETEILWRKKMDYEKIEFKIQENESVYLGVEQFLHKHKCDLLAIYHEKRGLLKDLFGHSESKTFAYEAEIPLLVVPKNID